jgi:hypothetical protein
MKTMEAIHSGLCNSSKGKEAIAVIAEHARKRRTEGTDMPDERLLSWESITEFGEFKITVRCDYGLDVLQ